MGKTETAFSKSVQVLPGGLDQNLPICSAIFNLVGFCIKSRNGKGMLNSSVRAVELGEYLLWW